MTPRKFVLEVRSDWGEPMALKIQLRPYGPRPPAIRKLPFSYLFGATLRCALGLGSGSSKEGVPRFLCPPAF